MSEHLNILDHSISVVGFKKNETNYVATYAWSTQVDYDKIVILIGSQSETGKILEKKQLIGISVLNNEQAEIANQLGSSHSTASDKLRNINYTVDSTNAITINEASRRMIVEVMEIYHLPEIEEDSLVYCRIISVEANKRPFLHIETM